MKEGRKEDRQGYSEGLYMEELSYLEMCRSRRKEVRRIRKLWRMRQQNIAGVIGRKEGRRRK